ncbi:hypothetical protein SAMN05421578_1575 [Paenibacillus macquariensis]|uniref:Uncharacterized protein n=1 Tax=Paenibacillus macquariensis TaxID=948756 RepID=A0ABY1KF11_9BACL|nr:hypothetical protein SAMN05421578_1575 [Paenibacillus macquariensis]
MWSYLIYIRIIIKFMVEPFFRTYVTIKQFYLLLVFLTIMLINP